MSTLTGVFLKDFLSKLKEAAVVCDDKYRITYANGIYLKQAATTLTKIVQRNVFSVYPKISKHSQKILTSNKSSFISKEIIATDGKMIEISQVQLTPKYLDSSLFVILFHDKTDLLHEITALRSSLQINRHLVELSNECIFFVNSTEGITAWNHAAEKLFGYTKKQALGKELRNIIFPFHYRKFFTKELHHFQQSGESDLIGKIVTLQGLHKDGHQFPIQFSITATKTQKDWNAFVIITDLSEKIKNEEELIDFKNKYLTALSHTNDAIMISDENSRFIEVSKTACLNLGYTKKELLNLTVIDIETKITLPIYRKIFNELKHKKNVLLSGEQRRKDGTTFPVAVNVTRIERSNLLLQPHLMAIIHNMSEIKEIEQEISTINKRYSLTFENANDFIIIADTQGNIVHANKTACDALGYTNSEFCQLKVTDVVEDLTATKIKPLIESLINGKTLVRQEVFIGKSQNRIDVETHISPIKFGNKVELLAIARDLTDIKKIEKLKELHENKARTALIQTIEAIAHTCELRDPYTTGHQIRVAQLSKAIAQELNLSQETIDGIFLGATIHDIGKIQIPIEILSFPGKLTRLQFEIIKTHPEGGYQIVKDIDFPWPIQNILHLHHERLDGSGYPFGLKAKDIPLEVRIVSVADVVEAMSSTRPYRAGLGIKTALAEINSKKGKCFDTKIVDICIKLFISKKFRFLRHDIRYP